MTEAQLDAAVSHMAEADARRLLGESVRLSVRLTADLEQLRLFVGAVLAQAGVEYGQMASVSGEELAVLARRFGMLEDDAGSLVLTEAAAHAVNAAIVYRHAGHG